MELEGLSIESISAWKQANIQTQIGVEVAKKAIDQSKVAGNVILEAVKSAPSPESGKGTKLNIVA